MTLPELLSELERINGKNLDPEDRRDEKINAVLDYIDNEEGILLY